MFRKIYSILFIISISTIIWDCSEGSYSDSSTSYKDTIQGDEFNSTVDTLLLMIAIRLSSPTDVQFQPYDGYFLDYDQIDSVRISVDKTSWGIYKINPQEELIENNISVDNWNLNLVRNDTVLVATLGQEDEEIDDPVLVGDWVQLLMKYLAPGGHIAKIEEIVLVNSINEKVIISPRTYIQFTINDGDLTALLGDIIIDIASLEIQNEI
jgi:hypothetical protein